MNKALLSLTTNEFIAGVEAVAAKFDSATYPQENIPTDDWALLVGSGVLLPALPKEYGGRDSHLEMCRVVETVSEWSVPLGVHLTVNTVLSLRPMVMRADKETRDEVLPLFAGNDPMVAGFAVTEPGCGSALSAMTTTFEEVEGGYRIRGRKHWQALSFSAHWWVVNAKNTDGGRPEYGLFIVKRSEGFRTVARYEPLGLKLIDYGLNEIDVFVPRNRRIEASSRDLSATAEILTASRAMITAMGYGFLRRISREAHSYAATRKIGRVPLERIGFARYRLADIDASHTIAEALAHHLRTKLDIKADMTCAFPDALALKTVVTERMHSAAQHYLQLAGGEGYRYGSPTNFAGQASLDARVFPIFDGTNDLLSQQLADYCLSRLGGRSLTEFLAVWPLTAPAMAANRMDLSFLDGPFEQEHRVLAGRLIAYLFAITQIKAWVAETGADAERARVATAFLRADIERVGNEFGLLATGVFAPYEGAAC